MREKAESDAGVRTHVLCMYSHEQKEKQKGACKKVWFGGHCNRRQSSSTHVEMSSLHLIAYALADLKKSIARNR